LALFFISAALLVIGVLAFLLPSLIRSREVEGVDRRQINVSIAQAQLADLEQRLADGELPDPEFQQERKRLESDLALDLAGSRETDNRPGGQWMTWPVALTVPILAGFVYLSIGTPRAIDPANRTTAEPAANSQQANDQQPVQTPPDMREVVTQIEQHLEQQPDDARGWFMLGRAHMALNEYSRAVGAIRRSRELTGDQPEVLIRLADAIAMSQQGSMGGEPESLLTKALALEPENPQGLWLLGMAQSERDDHRAAVNTWNRLLPLLQDDPNSLQEVQRLIASAQQMIDADPGTSQNGATLSGTRAVDEAGEDKASVQVRVTLQPGIADGMSADTALFVYAKAQQGPPMPLAVARRTLGDIPFTVTLSDADAMMPAMKLSGFDRVIIGARLSQTGNAIAQPGDVFGEVAEVQSNRTEPVDVNISTIVE